MASTYTAKSKFLIASPYKIRPLANLIRRRPYTDALMILENMPHKGARLLKKTLASAAANALNLNRSLDEDMLFVSEVMIDDGPRFKRLWCRGKGRGDTLLKRLCHISVVVKEAKGQV